MRKSIRVSSTSTARQHAPAMTAANGCAPPMPPRPPVRIQRPVSVAGVMLAPGFGEGLVGSLHNALSSNVNPGPGRHLAVHHQALAVELVEMRPGRPMRHEVRVRDQHPRRIGMGASRWQSACRTGRSASHPPPDPSAWQRSGRSPPRSAPPGRCRRRPPAHAGFRPHPGAGCSSASASPPRSPQVLAVFSGPVGGIDVTQVVAGVGHGRAPFSGGDPGGASPPGPPEDI